MTRPVYLAHGLQLAPSFQIPGLAEQSVEGLPRIELDLVDEAGLQALWSGAIAEPTAICAAAGDRFLSAAHGRAGDLLLSDGETSLFHLSSDGRCLACAPRRPGLGWQRSLLNRVAAATSVVQGYEALYASAFDTQRGAVAIMSGRETGDALAMELVERRWPLLSHDVLVLSDGPFGVRGHPGIAPVTIAGRWTGRSALAQGARRIAALCLLERGASPAFVVQPLESNPTVLARYVLGLGGDEHRRRRRLQLYTALSSRTKMLRIACSRSESAAVVADALSQAVEHLVDLPRGPG